MSFENNYQQTNDDIVQVKWNAIRSSRSILLKEADNLVSIALDKNEDATLFREYRQALRDIPQNYSDPDMVVWPKKPII